MRPGVYIGKQSYGDYGLISTGDYLNPVTSTFRLKDLKESIIKTKDLYLIIYDIEVEYIKVQLTGQMTTIRTFLSWDGDQWDKEIVLSDKQDASLGNTIIKPFKLQLIVDDFLEYFQLVGETSYKQYKLKLLYA